MRRALVTGATGFIGRGTLRPLLERGFEVHAVTSRKNPPPTDLSVQWHHVNLLELTGAATLVAETAPTHLLHLAWYAVPGAFWSSLANLEWVDASLRLLRAFVDNGGTRAVLAGTCAEYAWGERTACSETETKCEPATLYGASKHGLWLMAERYAAQVGMSLAGGRAFFVFGPGEDPRRLGGSIAVSLAHGRQAVCLQGSLIRDFLYSEDLADAFVALLDSSVEGPVNLASGRATSIGELARAFASAAGRPDLLQIATPDSPDWPLELTATVTRLRDEIGWAASADLEQRAADTIAWWRENSGS